MASLSITARTLQGPQNTAGARRALEDHSRNQVVPRQARYVPLADSASGACCESTRVGPRACVARRLPHAADRPRGAAERSFALARQYEREQKRQAGFVAELRKQLQCLDAQMFGLAADYRRIANALPGDLVVVRDSEKQ